MLDALHLSSLGLVPDILAGDYEITSHFPMLIPNQSHPIF